MNDDETESPHGCPIDQHTSAVKIISELLEKENLPLRHKQNALLAIAEATNDETVVVTGYPVNLKEEVRLKKLVSDYVSEQRHLEETFFSDEPDTVYLAEFQDLTTGQFTSVREPSLRWKACAQLISEHRDWEIVCRPHRVFVTKFYPTLFVNGFMKELTAKLNEDGELLDIDSRMMMTVPKYQALFFRMASLSSTWF